MSRIYELAGPRRGQISERSVPEPGPGQVLLRVLSNGVCASDLGDWITAAGPRHLGHEPVGEVVSRGPGSDIDLGTVVGGRIVASFADHALADVEDVVALPEGVDPTVALPEPVGCVVEGLRRTTVPTAARVAVIGLGFMGLVMVQLLRDIGVDVVVAIDPRDDALAAARLCGADGGYHPRTLPGHMRAEDRYTDGEGFHVVVEASGSQAGLDLATVLVRPHGTISILGFHQGNRTVDLRAWNWKALSVVNAHVRDRQLLRTSTAAGLALQAAGRIDISTLITHRYPLAEVDAAYAALESKPPGFIKAVIDIG